MRLASTSSMHAFVGKIANRQCPECLALLTSLRPLWRIRHFYVTRIGIPPLKIGTSYLLCRFSFQLSSCDLVTCGYAPCLASCHLRFVSNSCHFFRRCIWGHFGTLGSSACRSSRTDGIASRDSDGGGGASAPKLIDEVARLRTNVSESGYPRTVSALSTHARSGWPWIGPVINAHATRQSAVQD